ncbi:hypothetical protein MRX96_052013 [Rhipicephalus microplus]
MAQARAGSEDSGKRALDPSFRKLPDCSVFPAVGVQGRGGCEEDGMLLLLSAETNDSPRCTRRKKLSVSCLGRPDEAFATAVSLRDACREGSVGKSKARRVAPMAFGHLSPISLREPGLPAEFVFVRRPPFLPWARTL